MIRPDIAVGVVVTIYAPSEPEHGTVGKITSRQCGPLTLWGVNDQRPRWREDQLRLPDEPERAERSPKCRAGRHNECGGGWAINGDLFACTCPCGHLDHEAPGRPMKREAAE